MAEPPRDRLLRAIRVLVAHPMDPDALALLAAIETVLDGREAEVRAEAAGEARERIAEEICQHPWGPTICLDTLDVVADFITRPTSPDRAARAG